jgi:hypothetical protein
MAQLAIKGHPTRGKEVIEILEILGGKNYFHMDGFTKEYIYYICKEKDNRIYSAIYSTNQIVFTIEEFLEKFPYKIGDKVIAYVDGCLTQFTIQGIRWNHELNKVEYRICSYWRDTSLIQPYKEETMEVSEEFFNKYCIKCGSQRCTAEGEWLEECKHYKEETVEEKKINQMSLANCDLD